MPTTFDYENQGWIVDGRYVPCGHESACNCYGKVHEGELQLCYECDEPATGATFDGIATCPRCEPVSQPDRLDHDSHADTPAIEFPIS